jgi:hypothetical protein
MSSGGQQPVTQQTTQTRDPWAASQGALTEAIGRSQSMLQHDEGYVPYSGQTQASVDPNLATGINTQSAIANANLYGTPDVLAGQQAATNMIQNQGLSPELRSLYQQAQGDQNPYLQAILNTNNRTIGDRVNAAASGAGRYGSGAHTDVMTRALAESADPILAQDYARRQQQQQDILTGGLQRAGQWAQLAPTLDAAQYAPAERLASTGQFYQDRAQAALNDQIKLYNAQQARPWEQIARLNAIAGQAGGLGGTQVTASPIQQPSSTQSLFGGALAGAGLGSMFGPLGTGAGALGGGLLGLLNR